MTALEMYVLVWMLTVLIRVYAIFCNKNKRFCARPCHGPSVTCISIVTMSIHENCIHNPSLTSIIKVGHSADVRVNALIDNEFILYIIQYIVLP